MKGTRKWEIKNREEINLPFNSHKKLYNYLKVNAIDGNFYMVESDIDKISIELGFAKSTILANLKDLRKREYIILLEKKSLYKRRISNGFEPGTKEYNYRCQIKHRYNMSSEDLEKLKILQDNKCAICKISESKVGRLFIDHDHENGNVRGLLCSSCNSGIGYFSDNIEKLKLAIEYIQKNK